MTLTELAYYVRRFFPLMILSIIIIFILYIVYKIAELSTPPISTQISPTPTPAFGQITLPSFENFPKTPKNKEYFIDTISGIPETATTSAKIAFVPELTANFGFREKASVLAKALGFDYNTQEAKLKDKLYTVVDNTRRLEFEIDTFNYTFTQDFSEETKVVFANATIPPEDVIKQRALELMRTLNRFPSEIAQSTQTITYFSYQEGSGSATMAEVVTDPNQSNMIEVDFFPPKYNDFETVTQDYFTSPNFIVFVPQKNGKDFVIRAQVKVYSPSPETVSFYPLITGDDAFAELSNGNAYLVAGQISDVQVVNIKRIYTAYMYPNKYAPYLTPVYVFTGDNGFVSYVPAVAPLWLQK